MSWPVKHQKPARWVAQDFKEGIMKEKGKEKKVKKRPYEKPELICHGGLKDVVAGVPSY